MISHFQQHESDFVLLQEMLKKDSKVQHLWHDSITPEGVIDSQQWDSYRKVMKRSGIIGIHTSWHQAPEITFRTSPLNYSSLDKGYVFSTTQPEPIKDALDIDRKDIPPYAIFYKHIKGNWYIYVENLSD